MTAPAARALATAAALAVGLLALPAPDAYACSLAPPMLTLSRAQVPQGGTVAVSGEQVTGYDPCPALPPPVAPGEEPTETPTAVPSEQPSESPSEAPSEAPSGTPSEEPTPVPSQTAEPTPSGTPSAAVAPAVVAPAAAPARTLVLGPATAGPVVVEIGRADPHEYSGVLGPTIRLGTTTASTEPYEHGGTTHSFATTVTIPSDLAPGRYRLLAAQDPVVYFGFANLTVVEALPATGRDVDGLTRWALLLLLSGAGALGGARAWVRTAGQGRD